MGAVLYPCISGVNENSLLSFFKKIASIAFMFEAELQNSESQKGFVSERLNAFRKVVESLADIVEQMEIRCSDAGLKIQVMDSMHVALADVFFSRDMFSNYRCDRDVQLGIPIKHFLVILRGINLEDKSFIRFSCEDNPQILKIEHVLPDSRYEFNVTLYQIGSENYSVPEIEYETKVKMPSEQFRSISKLIGSFGEYISFECQNGQFVVKQSGDLVKNNMTLNPNESTVFIKSNSPVDLEIAMKYINLINKVSTLSKDVVLNLGNSLPVFFEVDIDAIGYVKFYIAPKMEN